MSNLLEEAIVDAKALKEAALKSAQETILEKYNPEVKKALESLLLEQEEGVTDPDMDALSGDPSAAPQTGGSLDGQVPMAATAGMNLCPCPDNQKVIEVDFADLQKAMSTVDTGSGMTNDMSQPLPPPMAPAEEAPAAPDVNANVAPEIPPEEGEEEPLMEDDVMDEEIELDEELINSLLEDEELFQEEDESQEKLKGGQKKLDVSPPFGKLTGADFKKLGDKGAQNKDNSSEEELEEDARFQPSQDAVEKIKDTKSPEMIASIAAKIAKELMTGQLRENKIAKSNEKKVLNETRVLAQKTSQLLEEHKKVQNKNKLLTEENARLLKEHQEMKATALEFAKQIEQMNVQNAKLYYKNQALGSVSLNERQKSQIVEAISKADSVDEVKIIFETLQSAVGSVKTNKEPKSLSEAVTRNSGFSIRTREKEEPVSSPAFDRWSKLAGIKK